VLKEVARIDDIPFLFLSYLKKYQDGYSLDTIMQKQTLLQKRIKRRRRSVETIKISTGIASFVSKVLSSIIKNRPKKNVVQILVTTVESFHLQNNITKEVTDYSMIDAKQLMQKYNVDIKSKEKDLHGSEKKTLVFFLAGLGGSGKSTLVSVLKGQNNPNCKPSLGFRPVSLKYSEDITVKLYDVGGGEKIRGIWNNYFHDAHGIIYIVDSACSQSEFQDTISVAKSTVGHKYLQGKPLLLISNKTDKPDSRSIDLICEKLNLPILKGGMTHTLTTSLHPARGSYDGKPDPKIDNALEWLIQKVVSNINELNERIIDDSKEMKAIQTKKQVSHCLFY
jgi:small GTP-binding protein